MGTKMFKQGSFEQELFENMQKGLVSNQLDNKYSLDKLAKVADYLNSAAELLDDSGFRVEADMITKVLKRLANEQDADENDAKEDFEMPEEIILEPLEQEIEVAPVVTPGSVPLGVDYHSGEIFEQPDTLEFTSVAAVAAKLAAKKKV